MPRTTVDIEGTFLYQLKALGRRVGRPLGRLISELVTEALALRRAGREAAPPRLEWNSKPMRAPFDWADKDAIDAVIARDDQARLAGAPGADADEDAGRR